MKKLFISHDKKDKWVRDWLVPHLQGYEAELLVEHLTFKIGISRLQNIEDAIEAADHTLLVVSPNWLASEWTELESLMVQTDSPANRKRNFLILWLEDCELPRRLRPFTFLDLTDVATHVAEIGRLMGQLGIPRRDGLPIPPIVSTATPLSPVSATPNPPPSMSPPDPPVKLPDLTDFAAVLEENKANLNRLKEQMGRPGKVIPFVGAGMSVPYGFKSWKDYLMFHAGKFGIAKAIEGLLNDGKYEEAAQVLLEAMSPHAFHAAITDEYGPQKLKDFQPRAVTALIPRLTAGPVITTNYDQVLERTFEGADKAFYRVAVGAQVDWVSHAVEGHRNILLKIHGDAEERTSRILTLAEYRQHYGDVDKGGFDPNLPLPMALSRLMGGPPLLFLGCSLEVDRTMKVLTAVAQSRGHGGHYAILPLPKDPSKLPARKRELSEHHVFPIWYDISNGHGMVEEILRWVLGEEGLPKVESGATPSKKSLHPNPKIDIDNLPNTSNKVFGREAELAEMMAAWDDPDVRVLAYVAQGGEGKTALTKEFLIRMKAEGYLGAQRVFAWSFYSQGATTDSQANSMDFIREYLHWLGDRDMAYDTQSSAHAKAGRIVELTRAQRTLLILDGVEPLQIPPNEPHAGELRDKALRKILKDLGRENPGLCLVSTRLKLADLEEMEGQCVVQKDLPSLTDEAGAELLRELEVKGREAHLQQAARDCHGHALSLTLLGNLLVRAYDEDIQKRDLIPGLLEEKKLGAHAKHILRDYERWLADGPALQVLRTLGLFDRPIELEVVRALAEHPPIEGITDKLVTLSEAGWKLALADLEDLRLIDKESDTEGKSKGTAHGKRKLDCHPLIREYFAQKLSLEQPEAWKAAHQRLYKYYKGLPEKELPDTLEEMEPLYRAMGHGCKAGLYQEVLDGVHWKRIGRGKHFQLHKLGAYSLDLAAFSGYFLTPWSGVQPILSEGDRAFILNETANRLRALGRLREAITPMEVSLEMRIKQENWRQATIISSNLSELRLVLGNIDQAVLWGKESVRHADASRDGFLKIASLSALADALFEMGDFKEAECLFREAEARQMELQPRYHKLYSLPGYWFCCLLLAKGEFDVVLDRAKAILAWENDRDPELDRALVRLTLAQIHLTIVISNGDENTEIAIGYLNLAVDCLRKAGSSHHIPRGLLARASLYRTFQDYNSAQADLAEAYDIAESGEMRLHLTDYHLESARLKIAMGDREAAKENYEKAKKLIAETGYHRRDGELEELRVELNLKDTPNP